MAVTRLFAFVCLLSLLAAGTFRAQHIRKHPSYHLNLGDQFENAQVIHTPQYYQVITKSKAILLLNVPEVFQATEYTCGPSSLTAVMNYYGVDRREAELAIMAKTNEEVGTDPFDMVNVAWKLGFTAELRENMTVRDLQDSIAKGIPVIVLIQAWKDDDDPTPYPSDFQDGHYVVAIGYDAQNIYFEDPWVIGSLGYIPKVQLPERWHGDTIYPTQRHIYGCGIIIQKPNIKTPTVVQLE